MNRETEIEVILLHLKKELRRYMNNDDHHLDEETIFQYAAGIKRYKYELTTLKEKTP